MCGVQITTLLVGHLVSRLEVEAGKNGGTLSAEHIRACSEKFLTDELPHFQSAFQRNYDECTILREEHRWSASRQNPLDRILTKKFAHLFPPRKGDDGEHGILSRRLLPGFSLAITKMIGPMLYEQCQRKALAIMQRHPTVHGGFDWRAIYADPDCLSLSNDVLVVVAHYFAEFDRRRNWFMALLNNNLAPVKADEDHHANWQLTNHGFAEMMRALFVTLEADLQSQPDKMLVRYGESTVHAISAFLERLKIES